MQFVTIFRRHHKSVRLNFSTPSCVSPTPPSWVKRGSIRRRPCTLNVHLTRQLEPKQTCCFAQKAHQQTYAISGIKTTAIVFIGAWIFIISCSALISGLVSHTAPKHASVKLEAQPVPVRWQVVKPLPYRLGENTGVKA